MNGRQEVLLLAVIIFLIPSSCTQKGEFEYYSPTAELSILLIMVFAVYPVDILHGCKFEGRMF